MATVFATPIKTTTLALPQAERFVQIAEASTAKPVETIEQKIGRRAKEVGYSPIKAQAIAWAESKFNPKAKNEISSASGVYQFLDGTFSDYCIKRYKLTDSLVHKNDPDIQIECALKILTTDSKGDGHWEESRPYWRDYKPLI